jgi:amino acid permease
MMKTQIGLGVLSIPVAFDALGVVPGVICLLVIAGITTWSDYIIGTFKLRHREVYGIDDVGELLMGKFGRILLGAAFVLCELAIRAPRDIILVLIYQLQGGSLSLALACWVFPLVLMPFLLMRLVRLSTSLSLPSSPFCSEVSRHLGASHGWPGLVCSAS